MIARIDRVLGKGVATFAVMLMALLVVQAPIATVDRALHAMGNGHEANAFAGALLDLTDHDDDHCDSHHDEGDAGGGASIQAPGDDANSPGSLTPHHHHQSDSPSLHGPTAALDLPMAWSSSPAPFGLEDDLRLGIGASLQERPPKTVLVHVA